MIIFGVFILFCFGTALGSFLNNVFVARYDPEQSLFFPPHFMGRSQCPHCKNTLSASELVPLFSFIFLRGKCASCKKKISFQYPLVEFVSGCIVAGTPLFLTKFYGISLLAFFSLAAPVWQYFFLGIWTIVFLGLLVMFLIDMKHYVIPDEFHIFFIVCGACIALLYAFHGNEFFPFRESFLENYALILSPFQGIISRRVFGAIVGGLFFAVLFALSRGRGMGMGDVKLAVSSGIVFGWPDMGLAIFLSFIFGGIWALGLFFRGVKTMKDKVPFAPFFVCGLVATVFFGHALMNWYFSVFHL